MSCRSCRTLAVVIRGFYDLVDLEEAREQYRIALGVDPGDVTALSGLALVEMRLGELDPARRHLETALRIEPDDPDLLLCSGNVHFMSDNFPLARSFYASALSHRPAWPSAIKNLALAYERLEKVPEAAHLWQAIVDDEQYGAEAEQRIRDLTE